ncbi:VOC family protein [Vitreimonas sp.]|jgi:catechol 2,3-dioxygenase-like lactoylglutathione lyase family enzyme|uniref:VOC family protein n=1 Tax=Vitreimonas sp. TaxID=3069702 RepID=UPI002EDA236B
MSSEPLLTGITQIALGSANPAALVAFYRDTLGVPVLFETNGMTFFQSGATRLMIGAAQPGQPIGGDTVIYFEPRDWTAAEAKLEQAGIAFLHPAQVLQHAPGRELALRAFKDPEGHSLALLGWRAI